MKRENFSICREGSKIYYYNPELKEYSVLEDEINIPAKLIGTATIIGTPILTALNRYYQQLSIPYKSFSLLSIIFFLVWRLVQRTMKAADEKAKQYKNIQLNGEDKARIIKLGFENSKKAKYLLALSLLGVLISLFLFFIFSHLLLVMIGAVCLFMSLIFFKSYPLTRHKILKKLMLELESANIDNFDEKNV